MPLKINFKKNIHKVLDTPKSFKELKELIYSLYGDTLPKDYVIEYTDKEGDRISISNEQDFFILYQSELKGSDNYVKVYVYPFDQIRKNPRFLKPSLIQNQQEFAQELKEIESNKNKITTQADYAPSDESIPSSDSDNREKIPFIKQMFKEVQKEGVIDFHPQEQGVGSEFGSEQHSTQNFRQEGTNYQIQDFTNQASNFSQLA